METGDDYIVGEIEKTKRRLKDISNSLEMQQQLLRLIVQVKKIATQKQEFGTFVVY